MTPACEKIFTGGGQYGPPVLMCSNISSRAWPAKISKSRRREFRNWTPSGCRNPSPLLHRSPDCHRRELPPPRRRGTSTPPARLHATAEGPPLRRSEPPPPAAAAPRRESAYAPPPRPRWNAERSPSVSPRESPRAKKARLELERDPNYEPEDEPNDDEVTPSIQVVYGASHPEPPGKKGLVKSGKESAYKASGHRQCHPGRRFHGVEMQDAYCRVEVLTVESGYEDDFIDIPTSEGIEKLGQAIKNFIQWPRRYVRLIDPPMTPSPPVHQASQEAETSQQPASSMHAPASPYIYEPPSSSPIHDMSFSLDELEGPAKNMPEQQTPPAKKDTTPEKEVEQTPPPPPKQNEDEQTPPPPPKHKEAEQLPHKHRPPRRQRNF
ncbi:uncharacterized protein [Miscanthus floridulus]|uniref:uncharacterized protein n=1 Tax=Miscanthus floridulus TaxID=154761 RepID=UPI00345A03C1